MKHELFYVNKDTQNHFNMLGIIVILNQIPFDLSFPNGKYTVNVDKLFGNKRFKSNFQIFIKTLEKEKRLIGIIRNDKDYDDTIYYLTRYDSDRYCIDVIRDYSFGCRFILPAIITENELYLKCDFFGYEYNIIISNEKIYFAVYNKLNNGTIIFELIKESVKRTNRLFYNSPLKTSILNFDEIFSYFRITNFRYDEYIR